VWGSWCCCSVVVRIQLHANPVPLMGHCQDCTPSQEMRNELVMRLQPGETQQHCATNARSGLKLLGSSQAQHLQLHMPLSPGLLRDTHGQPGP